MFQYFPQDMLRVKGAPCFCDSGRKAGCEGLEHVYFYKKNLWFEDSLFKESCIAKKACFVVQCLTDSGKSTV